MRRSIATCYSEHAVKVSDSYCSGPSNRHPISKTLIPCSVQNSVTCIYKCKLLFVTLTWHSDQNPKLTISNDPQAVSPEVSHRLSKLRGSTSLQFSDSKIDLFWNLSNALRDAGPEPVDNFYLVISVDSEIVLRLGDADFESENQFRSMDRIPVADFRLVSKCERFIGGAIYSTKARFCDSGLAHKIVIKCEREEGGESRNPHVLSVCIDERKMIAVKRLMWNFRGNQTIFIDGILVDLMWDVHDWFFNPGSGSVIFMFRTRNGLDSRLWLEENLGKKKEQEKVDFSLLICARKNPD